MKSRLLCVFALLLTIFTLSGGIGVAEAQTNNLGPCGLSQNCTVSAVWSASTQSSGTNNAQIVTTNTGDFTLQAGNAVTFIPGVTSTGVLTLNVDGQGSTSVHVNGGGTATAGTFTLGIAVTVVYNGSTFDLVSAGTLGTSASYNTGTSGATVALNNGGFTQSGLGNFTGGLQSIANGDTSSLRMGGSALQALAIINSRDVAVGFNAAGLTTTGEDIFAGGHNACELNVTGSRLTCTGSGSLQRNTTGHDLTANGFGCLGNNTTGSYSTCGGAGSLFGGDCDSNSFFGYDAGQGIAGAGCGGDNTGIGRDVMGDGPVTGNNNFGAAEGALNRLTSGVGDNCVGSGSCGILTTGSFDDAHGRGALGNYNGNYSIAMGYLACVHATTGPSLVCLGANTGATLTSGSNVILAGQGIDVPTATTSNYMSLADIIKTSGINTPSTSTTSAAGIWTFANPILAPNGAAGAPAYSFSNAADAGLFLNNASTHAIRLVAGVASTTSNGAPAQVIGGAGGATSGNAGAFSGLAGTPIDGNGASSNLIASNGATLTGADRNGGSNAITAGNAVNNGTPGNVTITAGNSPAAVQGGVITLSPGTSATGLKGYTVIASTVLLTGYTVSTLPAASSYTGQFARVYDALSPTWGSTPTGGGSEVVFAMSNGSTWIVR